MDGAATVSLSAPTAAPQAVQGVSSAAQRSPVDSVAATPKKKKAISAAKRRARVALFHRLVRYAIQIAFFILAPGLFVGAFNGVKYIFTQICTAQPIAFTSFVVLLVAALGFTIVFGRFFCGYACAFGTAGDFIYDIFEFIRSKTPIPRITFPLVLVRALSLVKYVVLAAICIACVLGIWSSYSAYSPWVAFSGIAFGTASEITDIGLVLLGAVALGAILRKRFFCQFLCPLGALFSLMPTLGVSSFTRTRAHCAKSCGKCKEVCPVDVWPDADASTHGECIACGCCADACPMSNVNLVAIRKPNAHSASAAQSEKASKKSEVEDIQQVASNPQRKTRDGWLLVRGTGVGVTLVKSAALLAVCWYVGIARYLPPLEDVLHEVRVVLGLG